MSNKILSGEELHAILEKIPNEELGVCIKAYMKETKGIDEARVVMYTFLQFYMNERYGFKPLQKSRCEDDSGPLKEPTERAH